MKKLFLIFFFALFALMSHPATGGPGVKDNEVCAPILLYHRLGPAVVDSMTVTTSTFESNLKYLKDHGYTVVPLRQLVDYFLKKGRTLPPKPVVIVADDGHKSVYSVMFPLIKKYRIPVTLFIYPSAISNAAYAMTWDQLREMRRSEFVDIQSHTYWHPNFKKDRKRMGPGEYKKFVDMQLRKSMEKLERETGGTVDMLAWPFGIYDEELIRKAREAGYIAAFTIVRRHACSSDDLMTLPRYLMVDADRGKEFERLLANAAAKRKSAY